MGGKIGFVFFATGSIVAVTLYFIVPDTRGLSFDEMDGMYANKISPRKFQEALKDRINRGEITSEATVGGQTVSTTIDHAVAGDKKAQGVATHVDHVNVRDGKAAAAAV